MTSPAQQPSPQLFFQTINAYQRSEALKAAIELEVFTAIGEGNSSAADIAKRCNASERGIRILCDFLCIMGFLTKDGDRYSLTPDSAMFLDSRSPAYLGGAIEFIASSTLTDGFKNFAEAVRKGGTVVLGGIHMSVIPAFDYSLIYGERVVRSVANNTRADGREFLAEAARIPVRTHVETFTFDQANEALLALKNDAIRGAGVLLIG